MSVGGWGAVLADLLVIVLLVPGVLFVVAGTVGVLRFGDLPTRLHAVAKADGLGLGLVVAALAVHALASGEGPGVVAKLVLVWLLALLATAVNSHLLAREPGEGTLTGPDDEGSS